jgi:2-methylisocitrate lyase-like PEP mutase family enzyme
VTVDLEGGYSDDPASVAELAAELASLGIAGINLEDAGTGGDLRPPTHQVSILRAVVAAAPDLFVNARTDTYWLRIGPESGRLAETMRRLLAYQDAGARGVFVPAVTDMAEIEAITSQVRAPLNLLWRPGLDMAQLAGAGVARVSTGSAPYRRALAAALATAVAARDGGLPPDPEVGYGRVVALLEAAAGPVPSGRPGSSAQSTPLSSA